MDLDPDLRVVQSPVQRGMLGLHRLLAGPHHEGPYILTRFVLARVLGLVFVAAFAAALTQLVPLVGAHGITPIAPITEFLARPTLFWWSASDTALSAVSLIGLILSFLLLLGVENAFLLILLWLLYLSIVHVGDRWYGFGWEFQLLETALLVALVLPISRLRPLAADRPPAYLAIVLLRWLAFRIMLGAGLIKLRGDPCWTELTCLDVHFETQPIPNPLSPYLHHLPHIFHRLGVGFNHLAELVLPWFVFGPRRLRLLAGLGMIVFQLTLIASGNLSFLNWLTLVPCLACLDDTFLRRLLPARLTARALASPAATPTRAARITAVCYAALVVWLSLPVVVNLAGRRQQMNASFDRLHLVNTYGAFGSVTTTRLELQIEGTDAAIPDDAAVWRPYHLPCKPGEPDRRPCWISPYHRRLDWLMWFAAIDAGDGRLSRETWLFNLLDRLLAAEPAVLTLFADPPAFAGGAPTFVRVELYRYRFTAPGEPGWWQRDRLGTLVRPLARDDPDLRAIVRDR